jgi:GlcNAc-P-P-Und epimerase
VTARGSDGMRVVVTGGSGFIGTNAVEFYHAAGVPVLSLDSRAPQNIGHRAGWMGVDVRDVPALARAMEDFGATHVLHLAARTDLDGRTVGEYTSNTDGVRSVVDAIGQIGSVERVVFASSRMVCPIAYRPRSDEDYDPPNAYGASKVAGEQIVRRGDVHAVWTIVRPTSIWGPWFDVPYRGFFQAVARGRYVHPLGHRILKSFGYVGNTVAQLASILEAEESLVAGRTLYLADDPPIEVGELAEEIRRALDAPRIRSVPVSLLRIGARSGDILALLGVKNPPLTTFRLDNLLTEMVYDLGPLRGAIGASHVHTMAEGVRATTDWLVGAGHAERRRPRGSADAR